MTARAVYPPAAILYLRTAYAGGVASAALVAEFSKLAGRPVTRKQLGKVCYRLKLARPEGYIDPGQGGGRREPAPGVTPTTRSTSIRACLRCAKNFPSEGAHERLCDSCRKGIADGNILTEPEPLPFGTLAGRFTQGRRGRAA